MILCTILRAFAYKIDISSYSRHLHNEAFRFSGTLFGYSAFCTIEFPFVQIVPKNGFL